MFSRGTMIELCEFLVFMLKCGLRAVLSAIRNSFKRPEGSRVKSIKFNKGQKSGAGYIRRSVEYILIKAMKGILVLILIWNVLGVQIGSDCSRGASVFCGTVPAREKLVCEGGKCKGILANNNCNTSNRPCASGHFCNSVGVCQACVFGCLSCIDLFGCSVNGCAPGFYREGQFGTCVALGADCLQGTSPTQCTRCKPGYWIHNDQCNVGPFHCVVAISGTVCETCVSKKYWDAAMKQCIDGPANCETPRDATNCITCSKGYYRYTDITQTPAIMSCKAGPTNCDVVSKQGECGACKTGYYLTSTKSCAATVRNCKTSIDANSCLECLESYFLHKSCTSPIPGCREVASETECRFCKDGYYLNPAKGCTACTSVGCATCNKAGKEGCLSCLPGYKKVAYNCQPCTVVGCKSCPKAYGECIECKEDYIKESSTSCVPCGINCRSCSSTSVCICKPGFGGPATGSCPITCPANCIACTSSSVCTTCYPGFYLMDKTCTSAVCSENCDTCQDAISCKTCNSLYLLVCASCTVNVPNCITCASTTSCSTCATGYKPNGSPATTCTLGSVANCLEYDASGCIKCEDTYVLNIQDKLTACTLSTQVTGCKEYDSTNKCIKCQDGYYGTSTPITSCTSASPSITKCKEYGNAATICNVCMEGYAVSSDKRSCIQCSSVSNCKKCTAVSDTATSCTACNDGYMPKTTAGVISCTQATQPLQNCGTYNEDSTCITCKSGYHKGCTKLPCVANCKLCASASTCATCNEGYYATPVAPSGPPYTSCGTAPCTPNCKICASPSTCGTCATGYYRTTTNMCLPGPANSKTPANAEDLDGDMSCVDGYLAIYPQPCVPCKAGLNCATCETPESTSCLTCPEGFIKKTLANSCTSCGSNCKTCSSETGCAVCKDGYWKNNNVCVGNKCQNNCLKCASSNTCETCDEGFYLKDDKSCALCDGGSGVKACTKPANSANVQLTDATTITTACVAGSITKSICSDPIVGCKVPKGPNQCETCAEGYWKESATLTCTPCLPGCKTCSSAVDCNACLDNYATTKDSTGNKITACTVCTITNFYDVASSSCKPCTNTTSGSQCVCSNGAWWNGTVCLDCDKNCKTCASATQCGTCLEGAYLDIFSGKCSFVDVDPNCLTPLSLGLCRSCMLGYYYNASSKTCQSCSVMSKCKACSSNNICVACETGYYLNATTCAACNLTGCDVCSSKTQCDMCKASYYWDATNKSCLPCHTGCKVCSTNSSCYMCNEGYRLNFSDKCEPCSTGGAKCLASPNVSTECLPKYYLDTANKTCKPCGLRCASCTQPGDANCITCVRNASLPAGKTSGPCSCDVFYLPGPLGTCEPFPDNSADFAFSLSFHVLLLFLLLIVLLF